MHYFIYFQVNEAHNLSPGKFTKNRVTKLNIKREKQAKSQKTVSIKRRRLLNKEQRHSTEALHEVIEGSSYQTAVTEADDTAGDTERLPTPLKKENIPQTDIEEKVKKESMIVFDLETTGLGK